MATYASILKLPSHIDPQPGNTTTQLVERQEPLIFRQQPIAGFPDGDLSALQSLILSKSAMDYSSFLDIHKQLLCNPQSISAVMSDEASRQVFLLAFPEKCGLVLDLLTKIEPLAVKFPGQELPLAQAFIKELVLPLLNVEHQDLFKYGELVELISACLQLFIICEGASTLIQRLTSQIAQFPTMVERFVSHNAGQAVLQTIVRKERYATSALRLDFLQLWIDKLVKLVEVCPFNHDVHEAMTKWRAISDLKAAYPPSSPSPSSSPLPPTRLDLQPLSNMRMRRLSKEDKKSGTSVKAEGFSVDPTVAMRFEYFGKPLPKTLSAARSLVEEILRTEAYAIFNVVLDSFPCMSCYGAFSSHQRLSGAKPNAIHDSSSFDKLSKADLLSRQENYGANLGLWRIIFSKQAMKDLASARMAGNFEAVENKLKDLAAGVWGRRRSLTKPDTRPGFLVPLMKAVYDSNGRIMWHVHVTYDESVDSAKQAILVWRIGDHKVISHSVPIIERYQKTYGKAFIEACKFRQLDPNTGVCFPVTFQNTDVLKEEFMTPELTLEESLDLHNAIITGKFYTITQSVLDTLLVSGSEAEFRFDLSKEENEIIRHDSSSTFILGRSGTGKTTCLVFKLVARFLSQIRLGYAAGVRQIFLTRSHILAEKLNKYIHRLIDCELGRLAPNDLSQLGGQEKLEEVDETKLVTDLWTLQDKDFPLVCSFDRFMDIIEKSVKVAMSNDVYADSNNQHGLSRQQASLPSPKLRRNSILRVPRQVDFETFNSSYWRRFPNSLKKSFPVDLVFSEILGIIKGSASTHTGLMPLTRDQYLSKSNRIAPLFTLESERHLLYDIYETYEKLKAEYQDWDPIDRARMVLVQLAQDKSILANLRSLVDELYIDEIQDQRLLEIELLFSLVKLPFGIHLAGDSAQCISRDSTFRFNDIKALFYKCFSYLSLASNTPDLAKPEMFKLAQNYRSHQGIISIGALLVDSLWKGGKHLSATNTYANVLKLTTPTFTLGFPHLIDKLLPESGKYKGPQPIFFIGFIAEDFLIKQSFGIVDINEYRADFGADQVVIVRDEEALAKVENNLGSETLVLTVLQSKGMEFDDVVVLNFFSWSPYQKDYKAWGSLIHEKYGQFDSKKHSVLCSEFKSLYVAITRCRAHLYFVEEEHETAELIVDLWTKRVPQELVEPIRQGDSCAAEKLKQVRSRNSSNQDSWKGNADSLMERGLYKQAWFCYKKARHRQGQTLATAFLQRQEAEEKSLNGTAKAEVEALYVKSALLFEEGDYPQKASECYEVAGRFKDAADMWTTRGKPEKAAPLYERCELWDHAAESYIQASLFTNAAKALRSGERYDKLVGFLHLHESKMDKDVYKRTSRLCNLLHAQGKMKTTSKEEVELLLGSSTDRELFYRSRGLSESLIEHLASPAVNKINKAFTYLVSIGDFERALFFHPIDRLKTYVSEKELKALIVHLLVRELRTYRDTHLVFRGKVREAMMIIPEISLLRDALIQDLNTSLKIENSHHNSDIDIRRYSSFGTFVRLAFLERIDERIERVKTWTDLPIRDLYDVVQILESLLRDQKITPMIQTYLGFHRSEAHHDSRQYFVFKDSPFNNQGDHIIQSIDQDAAVDKAQKWLGSLIFNAFYKTLQRALEFWNVEKPANYCLRHLIDGSCWRWENDKGCRFYHDENMTQETFSLLSQNIASICTLIPTLGFAYSRLRYMLPDDMTVNYRPKQRLWFENLLEVITFVSPIYQNPIPPSLNDVIRTEIERLLSNIHIQYHWDNLRDNFSGLLDELQRSQSLRARFVMQNIKSHIDFEFDSQTLSSEQREIFVCYQRTLKLGACNLQNAEPEQFMQLFRRITSLAERNPSQFSAFHAVLTLFERIATYLGQLIMSSPEAFVAMRSWVTTHIPIAKLTAVSNLRRQKIETFATYSTEGMLNTQTSYSRGSRQTHAMCLLDLMTSLIFIFGKIKDARKRVVSQTQQMLQHGEASSKERGPFEFKLTFGRKAIPEALLNRRFLDLIFICTVNLYSLEMNFGLQLGFNVNIWHRVRRVMNENYFRTGVRLDKLVPYDYTLANLVAEYIPSFSAYNGKEHVIILARNQAAITSRFRGLPPLQHVLKHFEDVLQDQAPASAPGYTGSPLLDPRPHSEENELRIAAQDEDTIVLTNEQLAAATAIAHWWRTQWQALQDRRLFLQSELGRATGRIRNICQEINTLDTSKQYLKHICILRLLGPVAYDSAIRALNLGSNLMIRFHNLFTAISDGQDFCPDELEKIDGLSEKANECKSSVERLKEEISVIKIMKMDCSKLEEMLQGTVKQSQDASEKLSEVRQKLDEMQLDEMLQGEFTGSQQ